jgi:DNA-binding CsgD family transcriptional regulator
LLVGARRAGMDVSALLAGMPFDERSLSAHRWVDWDCYCALVERVERACGPEATEWFMVDHLPYHEMQTLAGAFVDARSYYRLVMTVAAPMSFPACDIHHEDLDDGRIDVGYRLHEDARPCIAFQRLSIGAYRALSCYLGLPAARVDARYDDRELRARVTLPESRTLVARVKRRAREDLGSLVELVGALVKETQHPPSARPTEDADERARRFSRAYGLTPRQGEVLAALALGRSNKEIADALGCTLNTIEVHVTRVLRRVGVRSRSELASFFWRTELP